MTRFLIILFAMLLLPLFAAFTGIAMFATVLVHGAIAVWEKA